MAVHDKTPWPPKPKLPGTHERKSIGDCVLRFTAETDDLDKSINETVDRLQRALAAFKEEWNRK